MVLRGFMVIAVLATGFGAAPAFAGVDIPTADACIATSFETGQSPAECIDAAQVECLAGAEETPAVATLCFVEARKIWTEALGAAIEQARDTLPADLAAISGIELKYDILGGLMQCDRMEELSLAVSDEKSELIGVQKSRCQATTSGLAYARLKWRLSSQ